MHREPSYPGVQDLDAPFYARPTSQRATAADGTWPLPEEVARLIGKRASVAEHAGLRALSSSEPRHAAVPVPAEPEVKAPAFPRPPRPPRPAGLSEALQARWKEVLDRHDGMRALDHFELLDLPHDCGIQHVQRAFADQLRRYHPDKLPAELSLLQPYAMRVVARLHEARAALSSPRDRAAYLRHLGLTPEAVAQPETGKPASRRPAQRAANTAPRADGVAAIAEREQRLYSIRPPKQPTSGGVRLLRALRGLK